MRYRSFGPNGIVVSALFLRLTDGAVKPTAEAWTRLVYKALESGINCFEVAGKHPAILEGLSAALQAVDRNLIVVAWRIGRLPDNAAPVKNFSAAAINGQVRAILARSGLGYLDVAMLDDPDYQELPAEGLEALVQLREAGAARMIGISGADDALTEYIATGKFDVLGAPYNLISGWRERLWLRAAATRDMAVLGHDSYPEEFHRAVAAAARQSPKSKATMQGVGGYAFLDRTHGWSAEEICLAYALTEPALGAVQVDASAIDRLEALCAVCDRELPPGVAAQIEMARFSAPPVIDARKRA